MKKKIAIAEAFKYFFGALALCSAISDYKWAGIGLMVAGAACDAVLKYFTKLSDNEPTV